MKWVINACRRPIGSNELLMKGSAKQGTTINNMVSKNQTSQLEGKYENKAKINIFTGLGIQVLLLHHGQI